MLSPSPPPTSVNDVVFRKRDVNTSALGDVQRRITGLAAFDPIPGADEYVRVDVTPLRVVLVCRPPRGKVPPRAPLPRAMSENDARPLLRSVVQSVFALHKRRCASGALTPSSFLWDPTTRNVSMTKHVLSPLFFIPGTAQHHALRATAAPEVVAGVAYGPPADVWSFGVIMLHVLSQVEYETEDLVDTSVVSPAINHLSPVAVSLLIQCLKADPAVRPTIVDLAMHPYLMAIDDLSDDASSAESIASSEEVEEEESADDETSDGSEEDSQSSSSDD